MPIRLITFLLLAAALSLGQSTTQPSSVQPPRTVDEAVAILKTQWLSQEDRAWILGNPKEVVNAWLHHGFGTGVRNSFKLWGGNPELMASCGVTHPDSCSWIIINRLWESIRSDASLTVVRKLDCQFLLVDVITVDSKPLRVTTMGNFFKRLDKQLEQQLVLSRSYIPADCEASLQVRVEGKVDRSCWASVGTRDSVSLGTLLYGMSINNSFRVYHAPPELKVVFYRECHWQNPPRPPTKLDFKPKSQKPKAELEPILFSNRPWQDS